jgi:hypothetical protein
MAWQEDPLVRQDTTISLQITRKITEYIYIKERCIDIHIYLNKDKRMKIVCPY